jgi:hypothetical protein
VKLAGGLFVLMLAIAAVSFWAWRTAPEPPVCQTVEMKQSRSPDGRAQADLFEVRCGDSVATHVALHPPASSSHARSDVFIAAGRVPARLLWNDAGELVIETPAQRVLVEETQWRNLGVRVRRVR